MKTIYLLLIFILPVTIWAQVELNLEDCLQAAVKNHPRAGDRDLLDNISANNQLNSSAMWKPALDLNGQMSYQSDVIDLAIDLPIPDVSFPSAPKDQYKLYVEFRQTIYDGGKIKQQKEMEKISGETSVLKLDSEIDRVKSEVIELYFSIMSMQEGLKIHSLLLETLQEKKGIINSGIKNGLLMKSDLSLLEIEILTIEQEISKLNFQNKALLSVLSTKCNMEIAESDLFSPSQYSFSRNEIDRKEFQVFDNQKQFLDATVLIKDKSRLPVLFAFGQLGYGNPALNMLSDEFDSYYYMGVGLKWNIWDWNITKREKQNLVYQSGLIDNQWLEFKNVISEALTRQESIIESREENIENLKLLLQKRQELVEIYESQMREGTIKAIDYLKVVNQEKIARINLSNEEIALQKSLANYHNISGNL